MNRIRRLNSKTVEAHEHVRGWHCKWTSQEMMFYYDMISTRHIIMMIGASEFRKVKHKLTYKKDGKRKYYHRSSVLNEIGHMLGEPTYV